METSAEGPRGRISIIPIGGLGEIGLNCLAIEYDGALLVVDAGLMFPDASMPGVDLVIPDFSYLFDHADRIAGVVLTHGHEDHIGAIGFLAREVRAPIFGTRLTLALARERLRESRVPEPELVEITPRQKLALGPFELEFLRVSHSIVDGVAVAINTPLGAVIHTGDFKVDQNPATGEQTDLYKFAEYGEKGVLALLSDSTNADVPGFTDSEAMVGQALEAIFSEAPGRIILACFASSVARIRQVALAAKAAGRKLVFDGRGMVNIVKLSKALGYLHLDEDAELSWEAALATADHQLVIVATGSQGEPMSALSRMAYGEHRHVAIRPGDTVILSARSIPGHEKAVTQLIDRFYRLGARVVAGRAGKVHASGHGQAEELKLMLNLTRPRFLVPVHGEMRQLVKHGEIALSLGWGTDRIWVLENGRRLDLTAGAAAPGSAVITGRKLVDGNRLGEPEDPVLRSRLRLADSGLVVVTVALAPHSYELMARPLVTIYGVHYEHDLDLTLEARALTARVVGEWRRGLAETPAAAPDMDQLQALMQRELRQLFRNSLSRRPTIWPQIIVLDEERVTELL